MTEKKKSTVLDRLLKKMKEQENDPEYQEKHKYVRPSLEYQIGLYIGEYIHSNLLPTLSTDMLKTRVIIEVSEEETKKHDELSEKHQEEWYKNNMESGCCKESWDEYFNYNKELQKKYIPEKLECLVPKFDVDNVEELKRGIRKCLWDTDLSHYKCETNEDIEVVDVDTTDRTYGWVWCRKIILTRG